MFDHFDSEVSCEEYYCEDYNFWNEELEAAVEIFDAALKSDLTTDNSVV